MPQLDDTYLTLAAASQGLYKEKGSRFMAFAYNVETTDQIKAYLDQLRKEYHDARHHCYAYVLGADRQTYRVNDDGEPSGTGGRPIYNQILSSGVTNVLIVVVRYFGGILLGASGLANAYKAAARDALDNATITQRMVMQHYQLHFEYAQMNEVMRVIKQYSLQPHHQQFELHCQMQFDIRLSQADAVCQTLAKIPNTTIESINI